MANTFKFGNGNWAVKDGYALAYNDENNNFKPLPFDFTRASSATRVNRQGLIEIVPSGKPRIDFTDNTSGHLLLEPSRTNKVSTSNDFNGAGWNLSSLTATANQVVSPDGTLNASKLEMTGNGSLRNQSEAFFNDGYAYSIFIKKGNSRYVTIRSAFFTQSFSCGFDLDTLTAETNGKIDDYGNDWYRLSIIKNISGDVDRSGFFYLYLPNSLGSQTSVSGNYIYAYGGQIEDGTYATSYIPTEGSSVTRVVDDADNSLPSNDAFNSSGSVSILFNIQGRELTGSNSTGNNISFEFGSSNRVAYNHNSSNYHRIEINTSGYARYITTSVLSTENVKIGVTVTATTAVVYANGVQEYSASLAATHDFTSLDSIATAITEAIGNVKIKELRFYNTPLTNTELQNLTS